MQPARTLYYYYCAIGDHHLSVEVGTEMLRSTMVNDLGEIWGKELDGCNIDDVHPENCPLMVLPMPAFTCPPLLLRTVCFMFKSTEVRGEDAPLSVRGAITTIVWNIPMFCLGFLVTGFSSEVMVFYSKVPVVEENQAHHSKI